MEKKGYIPIEECVDRGIYRIHSRNLEVGAYIAAKAEFIGIREKLGDEYLFGEFHWDTGAPFGTVKPKELLGMVPDDIEVKEHADGYHDYETRRRVELDETPDPDGKYTYKGTRVKGWYFVDSGTDEGQEIAGCITMYQPLFDLLKNEYQDKKGPIGSPEGQSQDTSPDL